MVEKLQEKVKPIYHFVLKMLLFSIPLYIILWTGWESTVYQNFVAEQTRGILHLMGTITQGSSNYFTANDIQFLISWDCTGWKSILFFIALLVSTPAKLKVKALGLVIGLYSLFIINILRIVLLIKLAITYGRNYFIFVHDILWQVFGIITVLLLWILWLYFGKISFHPTN
ncbi:MAG: exosortase/archaeosortase family protein [Candidatus Aenigmatarchaeota archaeon]